MGIAFLLTAAVGATFGVARRKAGYQNTGCLILAGKYIPGPYIVEVRDDAIFVNRMSAKAVPRSASGDISEKSRNETELLRRFADKYRRLGAAEFLKNGLF